MEYNERSCIEKYFSLIYGLGLIAYGIWVVISIAVPFFQELYGFRQPAPSFLEGVSAFSAPIYFGAGLLAIEKSLTLFWVFA